MRFGRYECGGMVSSVPGIDVPSVSARCKIPAWVREHPEFAHWLANVSEAAAEIGDRAQDAAGATLGEQAEWLGALSDAAHRMRNALAPLERGGQREELTDMLAPLGDYLLWRARDGIGASEGRPVVPDLKSDARTTAALLERMATDLEALMQLCHHMQGKLTRIPSSQPKVYERNMVKACAVSFCEHFGRLPPKRSWFGDDFMPYVGQCLGLEIGHRIVGEVVAELGAHPAAG